MSEPISEEGGRVFGFSRRPTYPVRLGEIEVGGTNPIRVQSMTTTDTRDVQATAGQIEELAGAGCEIVRITVPSQNDVSALREIREEMQRRRIDVPLVADVHFTPGVAMSALEIVDKVRINPGNFADRKHFAKRGYTDLEYREEIERVADRFRPLVERAKELGRALRIGANHGSLSDRIVNRYGDTPAGMVESALEFLEVCEEEAFPDVIFSMKSSNPVVMIAAYRLLSDRLAKRGAGQPGAPLHLGVTEAGAGIDARVKSALGIGALLEEGLGDTIRVSLTENPANEIPVARDLAHRFHQRFGMTATHAAPHPPYRQGPNLGSPARDRFHTTARPAPQAEPTPIAVRRAVRVDLELGRITQASLGKVESLAKTLGSMGDRPAEGFVADVVDDADLAIVKDYAEALESLNLEFPLRVRVPLALAPRIAGAGLPAIVRIQAESRRQELLELSQAFGPSPEAIEWTLAPSQARVSLRGAFDLLSDVAAQSGRNELVISADGAPFIQAHRDLASCVSESQRSVSIALRHQAETGLSPAAELLYASTDLGAVLCEGRADAVSLRLNRSVREKLDLSYRILQASRVRITRAEFISCPSCGRTQFDLESVTEKIRRRTGHLRDVKIAIMGCIVNGPGEMADADFGYVGSGSGKVHLYVGHERVASHVHESEATDRLEELIRTHERWIDPVAST